MMTVKGMRDILPPETQNWSKVEQCFTDLMIRHGYEEIKMPLLEHLAVFSKAIGESTDILSKEIYAFADKNGDMLALRPEGTASFMRAVVEHSLHFKPQKRFFYKGEMFRRDRPQKGRYRQFYQYGVEVISLDRCWIQIELLHLTWMLFRKLKVAHHLSLQLNFLGNALCLKSYQEALTQFFTPYLDQLNAIEKAQFQKNPLRLLDSKNKALLPLIDKAPMIYDFLTKEDQESFKEVQALLKAQNIPFQWNKRLVRGLDYYYGLVFEWVETNQEGAQNSVCGGGCYYTGKIPCAGFAIGVDRLVHLYQPETDSRMRIYCIALGEKSTQNTMLSFTQLLRDRIPGVIVCFDAQNKNLSHQMKTAHQLQARAVIILGAYEMEHRLFLLRWMYDGKQQHGSSEELIAELQANLEH